MKSLFIALAVLIAGAGYATTPVINNGAPVKVYSNASFSSHVMWTNKFRDIITLKTNLREWLKISNGEWIRAGAPDTPAFSNVVVISFTTNVTTSKYTNRSKFTNRVKYTNLTTVIVTNIFTNGVLSNSRSVTNIVLATNIVLKTNITLRTALTKATTTNRIVNMTNVVLKTPSSSRTKPKDTFPVVRRYTNNVALKSRTNVIYAVPPQLPVRTPSTNKPAWTRATNTKTQKAGWVFIEFIR